MTDNTTAEQFLAKTMGHHWYPVLADEAYGDPMQDITITPAGKHAPSHFQSDPMNPDVATAMATKLGELGIYNPADFTRVNVGGPIVLLVTQAGVKNMRENMAFLEATQTQPLIGDTRLTSFTRPTHVVTEVTNKTPDAALTFLTDVSHGYSGTWFKDKENYRFVTYATDVNKLTTALREHGISPDIFEGNGFNTASDIRVSGIKLQLALDREKAAQELVR